MIDKAYELVLTAYRAGHGEALAVYATLMASIDF